MDNITRIEEFRTDKGWTRAELARQSGVPAITLEKWEKRERKHWSVLQLKKVADALEVEIEDLLDLEDSNDD